MTLILSLDDEPGILELLRLILEYSGYETIGTDDEPEALSILRRQPVDLFTQDMMRPGMGGLDFLHHMKSDPALRNIPVLVISAGMRGIRAEPLEQYGLDIDHDLDGYLQKPFGPWQLLETVETILRKHSKPLPPEESRVRARKRWQK